MGTEHVGYLVGVPLAGVLITVTGVPAVLWLDAASFVLAAGLVAFALPAVSRDRLVARLSDPARDRTAVTGASVIGHVEAPTYGHEK